MPLSSNAVIHFTREKSSLIGILKDDFHLHYCKETVILNDVPTTFLAPMVSFCDIPLSEIKNHIKKYGNYGIGLTKEWAARQGLNPVMYIQSKSNLSKSYEVTLKTFFSKQYEGDNQITEGQKALADIFRYMKNYQADLVRGDSIEKDYRFSDEREWRYVPGYSEKCKMVLMADMKTEYLTKHQKELEKLRLEFTPNDIKYIIINNDEEISEFVNILRTTKGKNFYHHDVERLTTRILTTDQIMSDI